MLGYLFSEAAHQEGDAELSLCIICADCPRAVRLLPWAETQLEALKQHDEELERVLEAQAKAKPKKKAAK